MDDHEYIVAQPEDVMEPEVDGTPIADIINTNSDGCYYRQGTGKVTYKDGLKRFTVFVEYSEQGVSIEEIDVDATDETDARIIGDLAIQWHYDTSGHIVGVEERFGMYM